MRIALIAFWACVALLLLVGESLVFQYRSTQESDARLQRLTSEDNDTPAPNWLGDLGAGGTGGGGGGGGNFIISSGVVAPTGTVTLSGVIDVTGEQP